MHSNEKLILQVAWGPRKETAAECADRWLDTQRRLAAIDPEVLGRWVKLAERDDGEIAEIELADVDTLRQVVEDGVSVRDNPPGEPIAELGFGFMASNGRRGGANDTMFAVTAGLYTTNRNLMNQARLEVYPLPVQDEPRWVAIAGPVLLALVAAWEPDHGVVTRASVRRAQPAEPRQPKAGYLTYLSAGRRTSVPADLSGTAAETADGGLLVSLIGPGGSLPGPEEVAATGAVLRAAGAFTPVPTDRPVT